MSNAQEQNTISKFEKYKRKVQPVQSKNEIFVEKPSNEPNEIQKPIHQVGYFGDLEQEKKFDKDKYQRKYQPGKERHLTRIASRATETLLGLPGNIIQFSKFIGDLLPEEPEFMKKDPSFLQKYGKKALETVPTSDDLKKISQDYFGLWTTPTDESEKVSDELIETFTNLMIPIGGQQSWIRSLAAAGGGVFSKELAKEYGAPEWAQEAVKFGTTLGISMFNPGGAKEYASNLYKLADQAIPDSITVPAEGLSKNLTKLRTDLAKGGGEMEKNSSLVIKWIDDVLKHVEENSGRLNVKEGQAYSKNINSVMGDPETLTRAKKLFPSVQKEIRKSMQQVESVYPEYWKLYRNADESFGAVAQGIKLGERVENAIKKSPLKSNLGILMASSAYDPRLSVAYIAGRGLVESAEILSQYAKSPVLRKYYHKMVLDAAKNNKVELMRTLQKIDKEAQKEEKKSNPIR